jgi:peptidoglycan/xylan/chitin deacetylase (PgdA/CDA1 family)
MVGSRLAQALIHARRDRAAVLAYHNVVPAGKRAIGDRSLHLPQQDFAAQLDLLCETHTVVELDSLMEPPSGNERPRAIITFDDAYLGAVTVGLEELQQRDLPVTVFLSPGCLDWEGFWWDRLADPDTGILSHETRNHALSDLGGRQGEIMTWARRRGLHVHSVPDYCAAASLEHLQTIAELSRVSIGSHTWSHPNLSSLSPSQLRLELTQSGEWIRNQFLHTSEWLAYPYGFQSPAVTDAVATTYKGALLICGGLSRPPIVGANRYLVPRINVPSGISRDGFRLALAGLRP